MRHRFRVGQGFDIHRFSDADDRKLILGGVHFVGHRGLIGHSDADVVVHAVMEAILGACGLGDIGQHFPDSDPKLENCSSLGLLEIVGRLVVENNFEIGNVDCSVVCESPKIAPHRGQIQENLSQVINAPVSVKGRRAEGLGAIGRGEGIACWAVAIVTTSQAT